MMMRMTRIIKKLTITAKVGKTGIVNSLRRCYNKVTFKDRLEPGIVSVRLNKVWEIFKIV